MTIINIRETVQLETNSKKDNIRIITIKYQYLSIILIKKTQSLYLSYNGLRLNDHVKAPQKKSLKKKDTHFMSP